MKSVSEYRKAIVAGIGSGVTLVVSALDSFGPFLSADVAHWLAGAVALATAVATYLTTNAETIDHLGG